MRQLQLIDARSFRTQAERITYIRGRIDELRIERQARKQARRRRSQSQQSSTVQHELFAQGEDL